MARTSYFYLIVPILKLYFPKPVKGSDIIKFILEERGQPEAVNQRRTDNTMVNNKRTGQTMRIYKTLHRKLNIELTRIQQNTVD